MTIKEQKFSYRGQAVIEIEGLIQEESYRLANKYTHETFTPEHIAECPRRIIYRSLGQQSESSISYLEFSQTERLREKWTDFMGRCRGIKVIDKNVVVADWERNLYGSVDVIIKYVDDIYVVQVCGVQTSEIEKIRANGAIKNDVLATMLKLWMIEKKNGFLLYDDQQGNFCIFQIKYSTPIINSVIKKCNTLLQFKLNGGIPARPYNDKMAKECTKCEYQNKCWDLK
ncbi:MAG: hypothetical protein WC375_12145 [Methanomassiliicoccales archaeon]